MSSSGATDPLPPPKSCLFINVARIGDTLFATPAMRAVAAAYPDCLIDALAHPKRAEVLEGLPFLNSVGTITKNSAPWRGWFGRHRYDYAFVYGNDEPLTAYALRAAKRVVAFRHTRDAVNRALYRCIEEPATLTMHAVLQRLLLTDAVGIAPASQRIAYEPTPGEKARARTRLAADVPAGAAPLVGLHVATFPMKTFRRWPIECFAGLAEKITSAWPHAHFLIYGGDEEPERVRWLKDHLAERATLYAGSLSLRETGAVMSQTDLYVGLDTGPTHIMSAFDIPLVVLHHCRIPGRYVAPLGHPLCESIDHPRLGKGDCTDDAPMSEISVDTVMAAVTRLLAGRTFGRQ
jgi:heptosyltransferase-3